MTIQNTVIETGNKCPQCLSRPMLVVRICTTSTPDGRTVEVRHGVCTICDQWRSEQIIL